MDILVIFDDEISISSLTKKIKNTPVTLYLFSLTSDFLLIEKILCNLNALAHINTVVIESAQLINQEVSNMQTTVHEWSQKLANYQVGQKNLKEWFLYPDKVGSAWWLGLIAEKNTVQDAVFFKIAQINAIEKQLATAQFDYCLIAVADTMKRNIIFKTAKVKKVKSSSIDATNKVKLSFKKRMLNYIGQNAAFAAGLNLYIWLQDSIRARLSLPHFKERIAIAIKRGFTFVTYFPHIDESAAKDGVFINKYVSVLQNEFKTANRPVTWLAMPVFYNGHRFKSSVALAQRFIAHDENLFLLQEFFTFKIFFKSILWWIKQCVFSEILLRRIPHKNFVANLTHTESLPFIRYLWRHSFMGSSAIRGIIFYLTYQQFFKLIPSLKTCLYFCEMQAWEKALNIAKKQFSPRTLTYAFQHTVVMRNYFNYFYAEDDLLQSGKNTDMPLPNILIANGPLPYQLLARSRYPHLRQAEAIRQLYLNKTINGEKSKNRVGTEKVLLIGGSCDSQETKSLISLVYCAFPRANAFEIWFKGSPVNPVIPLFAELGINISQTGYRICEQDIAELLPSATLALIANTTVAIEAAAFGCEVIVPLFADTMLMNPLIETDAHYHLVSTPHELKMIVNNKIFANRPKTMNKAVITQCWHINPNLNLWKELLTDAKAY